MRAYLIESPGEDAQPVLAEVPTPPCGPNDVLVEVHHASINWADTQQRRGVYPSMPQPPFIPGLDCAGAVAKLGENVKDLNEGDLVAAISPTDTGAFAEFACFPRDFIMPLLPGMSTAQGAALLTPGLTAYHLLFSIHRLEPDEFVLVHAISGGVGLYATQLAVDWGAKVIGTTYSPAKIATAKEYGAHHVIDRNQQEFGAAVLEITGGRGADVVIDSLGGKTLWRNFEVVNDYANVISIGEAEDWPQGEVRVLRDKLYEHNASFTSFELLRTRPGSKRWNRGVAHIWERVADGRMRVPIAQVFPFERAMEMYETLEGRSVTGKLLLQMKQAEQTGNGDG